MEKYKGIEEFYNVYIQIERVKRTGWVMRNVPAERIESVSDHTLQVIVLAITLCNELHLDFDISELTQMCFIHDLGESLVGDISEIDIDYMEKKKKEKEVVKKLVSSLSATTAEKYVRLWTEMDQRSTPLGEFAFNVDKMDAVLKAKKYAEEYAMPELFKEFYEYYVKKGTFEKGALKEMFEGLNKDEKNINHMI